MDLTVTIIEIVFAFVPAIALLWSLFVSEAPQWSSILLGLALIYPTAAITSGTIAAGFAPAALAIAMVIFIARRLRKGSPAH